MIKHKAQLKGNDTNKQSDGLPFVPFTKNTSYYEGIYQSPYETMFGIKPQRGIASSSQPDEQIEDTEAEEQLEEIVNTFEESFISGHSENHIPNENIEKELQPFTFSYQVLTEKHELISIKRTAAKMNVLQQATKMLRISNRKFSPAQIGDTLRIQVRDVDRNRTNA